MEDLFLLPEELDEDIEQEESELLENKIEEENIDAPIKLDYKLTTCAERAALVERIVAQTPPASLTNRYLEILGDYIMGGITKEERREHKYLTDNRMITINKREVSLEGMVEKFENGEDGIYNLMTNDKNIIFAPKISITKQDIEEVPGLQELRDAIAQIEAESKSATGRRKYLLKKQLIEMRRDQYILKSAYKPIMATSPSTVKSQNKIDLAERRWIDKDGNPQSEGLVSFFNPDHISALMRNYNALKIETKGKHWSDFYYLMTDFDALLLRALQHEPLYFDIVKMKMNNKTNAEIQILLKAKYNKEHTVQYISSLWCNKIPKLIAEQAQNDYLIWYYANEKPDAWKQCSCCGERKPAHPRFFTKDKTTRDGYYGKCKACRNKKK